MIARTEPRMVDQRVELRHEGMDDRARICFRESISMVSVINISSQGAMVESDIAPRLGEMVTVEFDGCSRIRAFVRWSREGRVGLSFGGELVIG